jgi:DNA-binding NtrC family response regulator
VGDDLEEKTILVLDSKDTMARRVRELLTEKPRYRVEWTDSYEEALRWIQQGRVDLIFYEAGKALSDGVDRLDKMKDNTMDIPVVVSALLDFPPPGDSANDRD